MEHLFITDIDTNVIANIECDSYKFDIVDGVPIYYFFIKGLLIMSLNASHLFVHSELYMELYKEGQFNA